MKRAFEQQLIQWSTGAHRKPLLVRGARQVGKTFCIRQFAKQHFENVLEINFELQREYGACFDTLDPADIIQRIYTLSHQKLLPSKSILFLDEIQECPNAILALRYFYEKMPELHVIAAGSLLEFTLRQENFRMPVGRVQSLYMYPLSFKEFLQVTEELPLVEYLEKVSGKQIIEPVYHERLLSLLRRYLTLGGMPEVVSAYKEHADLELCQQIQVSILDGYRGDFGKYAGKTSVRYLQKIYEKMPGMIAQHFRFVDVDPDAQARDIKPALEDLIDAGLVTKVQASNASGLPLASTVNEKKFKLLFLDIGLVSQTSALSAEILMQKDLLLINRGRLTKQFVGQELLAYASPYIKSNLYYWERNKPGSTAEVDYLSNVDSTLIPIEVKSGAAGRLKSIQVLLDERKLELGVQISQSNLHFANRILSIPLYLISELPRLVNEYL